MIPLQSDCPTRMSLNVQIALKVSRDGGRGGDYADSSRDSTTAKQDASTAQKPSITQNRFSSYVLGSSHVTRIHVHVHRAYEIFSEKEKERKSSEYCRTRCHITHDTYNIHTIRIITKWIDVQRACSCSSSSSSTTTARVSMPIWSREFFIARVLSLQRASCSPRRIFFSSSRLPILLDYRPKGHHVPGWWCIRLLESSGERHIAAGRGR